MDDFLKEAKKHPVLPGEIQKQLIIAAKQGDQRAKEKLLLSNSRLVLSIAQNYRNRIQSMTLEDLLQEGMIGLNTAIENFDLEKGTELSTYATWWIRQAITRAIDEQEETIRVPVHQKGLYRKYKRFMGDYYDRHHEEPDEDLVLDALGITPAQLKSLQRVEQSLSPESIDKKIKDDSDTTKANFIPVAESGYEVLETEIDRRMMLYTIKNVLTPDHYYVIFQRYYQKPIKTLEEVAAELNLTRERIRQIEKKALAQIKKKCYPKRSTEFKISGTQNIRISDFDKLRLEPISIRKRATAHYLKQMLPPLEYHVYYHYYISEQLHSIESIAKKCQITSEKVKTILREINKKIGEEKEAIDTYQSALLKRNTTPQFFALDLSPAPIDIVNPSEIRTLTNYLSFEEICQKLNPSRDLRNTLEQFFGIYEKSILYPLDAENELNALLLHYAPISLQKLTPIYATAYQEYKQKFNVEQQAIIEYAILGTMSKTDFLAQGNRRKKSGIAIYRDRLAQFYFGISSLNLTLEVSKETKDEIFTKYPKNFSDLEIDIVNSVIDQGLTFEQVAENIGKTYRYTHDRYYDALDKIMKYYYRTSKIQKHRNLSPYLPYLENPQYELTKETRQVLTYYIKENMDYKEIAEKMGLAQLRVNNLIIDGLRRLDFYRFHLIGCMLFTEEELETFIREKKKKYTEFEKSLIRRRFFEGEDFDTLKENNPKGDTTARFLRDFLKEISLFYAKFDIDDEDIQREIDMPRGDSCLSEKECEIMAYYIGYQCRYNPTGEKLALQQIAKKCHVNKRYAKSIAIRIRLRKNGNFVPTYGAISAETLEMYLKDPHVPISEIDKNIMIDMKGLYGHPTLTEGAAAKKYGVFVRVIARRFQRALLQVLKYEAKEIDGKLSWEIDVEPNLKYFAPNERDFLREIYKENLDATPIAKKYHISINTAGNIVRKLKWRIMDIINYPEKRRFDFESAETILQAPDFPIIHHRKLLTEAFKLFFGYDGMPLTIVDIKKKLQLPYGLCAIGNGIVAVMLAVEYYKLGIRNDVRISDNDVQDYYLSHKDSLSEKDLVAFQRYFKATSRFFYSNQLSIPKPILYRMMREKETLPFAFSEKSREDAISLLRNPEYNIRKRLKFSICDAFGIAQSELLNGRDILKICKLLQPLYIEAKEKSAQKKLPSK